MSKVQKITGNIQPPNKDLETLKKHFSQCFDKRGNLDFDKFKTQLSKNEINFSKESYGIDWLGKSYARLLATDETSTLLKGDEIFNQKEENKNSENLLIKGDNLEVLKHLSNAYYEKIKMIYIDPPYNTGSDGFVYADDRKFTVEELQELAGVNEERAKRILDFTQSKSNAHSAWLTFMYPRLYIAKQLLKDDGVIFISIDDNEVAQLRLLMDEVFGEENYINEFVWINNSAGRQIQGLGAASTKEYILCFAKSSSYLKEFLINIEYAKKLMPLMYKGFNFDIKEDTKGKYIVTHELNNGNSIFNENTRPNLVYKIYFNSKTNEVKTGTLESKAPIGFDTVLPKKINNGNHKFYAWRWSREKVESESEDLDFININGRLAVFTKRRDFNQTAFKDTITNIQTTRGANNLKVYKLNSYFTHPKPVDLIELLIKITTYKTDLILDFFAGSGTTGDAVMQLNAEDGENRKFILVQLPELIDPKSNKTAYDFVQHELKVETPTIFDITKERLIRASKKIQEENKDKDLSNQDLGFKVFETTPIWEDYNFESVELEKQTSLFDESKLTQEDLKALLVTWKTYDGASLSQSLQEIDLTGYIANYSNGKLYLMDKDFKTKNLKTLLEKIDSDSNFNPTTIIAFGYHFESKNLREISENMKSYANKKSIDIDFITRY
jgi:adenine-specific DNA-methyltransferase